MTRLCFSSSSTHRATAWILFWICLWMGTGVTLHHTDAGPVGHVLSPMSEHRPTAAAPVDHCAACEWTQGLQSGSMTFCPVPTPLFTLHLRTLSAPGVVLSHSLRHHSSRAPPQFLFAC